MSIVSPNENGLKRLLENKWGRILYPDSVSFSEQVREGSKEEVTFGLNLEG